jgi:hypothetical protein
VQVEEALVDLVQAEEADTVDQEEADTVDQEEVAVEEVYHEAEDKV